MCLIEIFFREYLLYVHLVAFKLCLNGDLKITLLFQYSMLLLRDNGERGVGRALAPHCTT